MINTTGYFCTDKTLSVTGVRRRKNNGEFVETMYNEKKILKNVKKKVRNCDIKKDRWEDR